MKTSNRRVFRRALSLALTIMMLLSVAPVTVSAAAVTYKTGDTVEFGSYPQSKVTDATVTAALAELAGDVSGWTSYDYYISCVKSDFMKYTDVVYNNEKYRGVYFTRMRPSTTDGDGTYVEQGDNGYAVNTFYWFKFEPIKWRVLSFTSDKAVVMSESVLDVQQFYYNQGVRTINGKTVYPNNYEYSEIREWLNESFYNWAFSAGEKAAIVATKLDNTATVSTFNSNATTDNVWLLSQSDVLNTSYGFSSSADDKNEARKGTPTEYAKSQGIFVNTSYNTSAWMLRTARAINNNQYTVAQVAVSGKVRDLFPEALSFCGTRPALTIAFHDFTAKKAESAYLKNAATCTESAEYYVSCSVCGDSSKGAADEATFTSGNALGHDFTEKVIDETHLVSDATCTAEAVYNYDCSRCDEIGTVTFEDGEVLGHDFTREVIDEAHLATAATCTAKATYYYGCSRCDEIGTEKSFENGEVLAHNFGAWTHVEDTKTHTRSCVDCTFSESGNCADAEPVYTASACTKNAYTTYTCDDCGYVWVVEDENTALDHVYGDWKTNGDGTHTKTCGNCTSETDGHAVTEDCTYTDTVTAPNCEDKGYTTHTCTECGYSYVDTYVDALGHKEATRTEEVTGSTCVAAGSHYVITYCTVCDKELKRVTESDALASHTYGEEHKEDIVEATCEKAGSYNNVIRCTVCEIILNKKEVTIPATGHTEAAAVTENVTESTCTANGKHDEVVYCSVCNKELSRVEKEDALAEHTSGEAVKENVVDAKCEVAGSYDEVVYCTVCKKELTRETKTIDALGHEIAQHPASAPDCLNDGNEAWEDCHREGCGYTTYQSIPALGHDFTEEVIDDAHLVSVATCTAKAVYKYDCSRCDTIGEDTFEYGDALGHDFSAEVMSDEYLISGKTCTQRDKYYKSCTRCALSSKGMEGEATFEGSDVVLGHNFSEEKAEMQYLKSPATCTEAAVYFKSCSRCGEAGEETFVYGVALGHTLTKWVVTKAATCTAEGEKMRHCENCDLVETQKLDKIAHADADKNGKCDTCDGDMTSLCDHICHSSSKIMQFFWKIIRFFQKLFKINQECPCGAKHW